jgi:hypothetical protein
MRMGMVGLAVAVFLASGCAVNRYDRGGHGGRDAYRVGLDRGYDDGFKLGRVDGHRYHNYNYEDAREYRQPESRYRSGFGARNAVARGSRGGYARGDGSAVDGGGRGRGGRGRRGGAVRRGARRGG